MYSLSSAKREAAESEKAQTLRYPASGAPEGSAGFAFLGFARLFLF